MHCTRRTAGVAAGVGIGVLLASGGLVAAAPAQAAPAIVFTVARYDPPGKDVRDNAHYNAEYVVIKNVSTTTKDLTGWTIRDESRHVYTFPKALLGAGKTITLHSGRGTDTARHRYWGYRIYVWNNDADKATLKNASGKTIDTCRWTPSSSSPKKC